jgi:hypothetical protein
MIRSVWESPTNEGTGYWRVGNEYEQIPGSFNKKRHMAYDYEWKCGRIILWHSGQGLDESYGWRVIVVDTDGKTRVNLPAACCAWEFFPGDEDDDE